MLNFVKFEELYTVTNNNYYYPVIKCNLLEDPKTFINASEKEDGLSMITENKSINHKEKPVSDPIDIWFMFSEEESLLQFYEDPLGKTEIDLQGFSFMNDSVSNHLKSKLDLFYFFEGRKRLALDEYISDVYFTNLCMKEENLLYDYFRAVWVAYSYNNGKGNQITEEDFRWYTQLPVLNTQKYTQKISQKLLENISDIKSWEEL